MYPRYYHIICNEQATIYFEDIIGYYDEFYIKEKYYKKKIEENLYDIKISEYDIDDKIKKLLKKYPDTKVSIVDYYEQNQIERSIKNNKIQDKIRPFNYIGVHMYECEFRYILFNIREEFLNYMLFIDKIENEYKLFIEDFDNNKGYTYQIDQLEYDNLKKNLNKILTEQSKTNRRYFLNGSITYCEDLQIYYHLNDYMTMNFCLSDIAGFGYDGEEFLPQDTIPIRNLLNNFIQKYNKDYQVELIVNKK